MASPEIRAVQKELIAGLTEGVLNTLSEAERSERIGELTTKAMTAVLRSASREIGPLSAELTRGAVTGAMDAALKPRPGLDLEGSIRNFITTTVRSTSQGLREAEIGSSVASSMTEHVGPALEQTLRDDLGPGLAGVLKNEELNQALGATARLLGREMVLGATDALAQTQPQQDGSLLARATELARQGTRLFGSAAWLFLLVIVALFAWIMKLVAQARRYREEADRRAATARLLAEAGKAAEGKPWSGELIGALQERIQADEEAIAQLRRAKGHRWRRPKDQPPARPTSERPRISMA